jgi:glycosyltransferase involved in cell wall biosynthesis
MKIKVLVINSDMDGVGYHRLLSPYMCFNDPDIEVDIRLLMDSTLPLHDEFFMSQYQILVFNKGIPFSKPEYKENFKNILKKYNIKTVFDIDDGWILTDSHPNFKIWKQQNGQKMVEDQLREADAITTTTDFLANKIREINPNVTVVPNSVNLKEQQWCSNKLPRNNDKIRFLWGGGITHMVDLRLLKPAFEAFDKSFLEKTQMYLCGYDLRMNTPQGMKKDDPRRSHWTFFESIFNNNRKWIKNAEYNSWLMKAEDNGRDNYGYMENFKSEFYQRRWTKPIITYGTMYNDADVVITPLKNNLSFNQVKSQLKIVEAGAHHCPIICSNYGPYTIDDIEGKLDGKQKGFLVDENTDSPMKWYECMKYYVENPDKIKEHGENLFEHVRDNYSIEIANKKRSELFKKLVDNN